MADVIDSRRAEIAEDLVVEHGKPMAEAIGEVASAANGFRLAAAEARRLTGETIPVEDPRKRVMTFRQPRGVMRRDHSLELPDQHPGGVRRARPWPAATR